MEGTTETPPPVKKTVKARLGALLQPIRRLIIRIKSSKPLLIISICVLVVIVGAIIGGMLLLTRDTKPSNIAKDDGPKLSPQAQLVQNTSDSLNSKNFDKALSDIDKSAEPESKDNLILKGFVYQSKGEYQQAYDTFRIAEKKYGLDTGLALNLATTSAQLKDKNHALYYYSKALELLKKDSPNYAQTQQVIAQSIKELSK